MRTLLIGLVFIAGIGAAPAGAQPAPVFTAEDMLAMRTFAGGQPIAVASTGRWIAYVLTDNDDEWNVQEPRPTGYIQVLPLGSARAAAPRALTSGAVHSAFPVWSADGRRLAFIREEKGQGRVVVWDSEHDQMTPVGQPFTARAYLAPQWDAGNKTLIVAIPTAAASVAPYRVRSVKNSDARIPGDQFFVDERAAALTAIDVASGKATALTSAPVVVRSFRLSPNGRAVLYVSPDPQTLGVIGKEQNDTFVLPVGASGAGPGVARKLTERGRMAWSPDK